MAKPCEETCRSGEHAWVEENIYTSPQGARTCRECRRESARRYQAKQKRSRKHIGDAISHADRAFIYIRDGKRCLKCGSPDQLTIDHIVPVTMGGENHWTNYQTLCSPCNAAKGATIADYRPTEDGQPWLQIEPEFDPSGAIIARFEEKFVELGNGCWEWRASGQFSVHGVAMPAARASVALYREEPPPDRWVARDCGNLDCVNPEHLSLVKPGNQSPVTQRQVVCRKGHPLKGSNEVVDYGVRRCRRCRNDKQARYNRRKRRQKALAKLTP